ncbi:MAG: MotA/TolQ/ExbB proton channel family protein, partial [Gammaproteobacteria bacterium]|nr:MotA/TolQ/ExbB proton channel family protein [Gammaproteobacteria bacterium]
RLALRTAFLDRTESPLTLVVQMRDLAKVVRKDGILGLESFETQIPFLQKGINLCVDGHPPEFIEDALLQEMQQTLEHYETAEKVFRGIGDAAPALGMLGTLVGLVQMLNNMQDPSSIGPAMAIALLTTFYGAFIAQIMALPLADKLQLKTQDEQRNMVLIITSLQNILRGQNPRVMTDLLSAYLTPELRARLAQTAEG